MKIIILILLFITSMECYSQQKVGWVYLGKEIGYEFYYKQNTIVRGNNYFVVVVGIPQQEMKDPSGVVINYVSANVTFYESTYGLRCMISNHIYYYSDNTFKNANLPKRDLPISHYALLSKLYNAIR
jgi:hypothetical protein